MAKNYTGKHPGGRPSKFKPEYIQAMRDFFDIEPYQERVYERTQEYYKDGTPKKDSTKTQLIPNKLPTLFQFAKSIGVSYWSVWNWAEKGESELEGDKENEADIAEFSKAYKEAKELQKEFLINNGLANAANASVTIFTAKNLTDMRDKQEVEHSGELKVEVVDYSQAKGNE